jgi:dipeptidyl aminopeptidase/acylaminoacyl peptidase
MTAPFDLDRALGQWMEADALPPAPSDLVSRVTAVTAAERPSAAWLARARHARVWPRSFAIASPSASGATGPRIRPALILALVALLAALLGGALIVGSRHRPPPPFGPAGNGSIVYSAGGDLYLGNADTGESRRIVTGPEQDVEPIVSMDGARIVFWRSTGRESWEDIVVADADGSNQRVVTPTPVLRANWMDFTPDGRSVLFVSEIDGMSALQRVNADGTGYRVMVGGLLLDEPAIRPPDGREILFRAMTGTTVTLYVINADGSNRHALITKTESTNPGFDLIAPRYSPDGSQIAYQAWSNELEQMRVWIMNADGTGARQLPHDPQAWFQGWPVWSPDGTRLAIQRMFGSRGDPEGPNGRPFAVIAADGRSQAVEIGPPFSGRGVRAEWSPDGKLLLAKTDDSPQLLLDPSGGPWRAPPWESVSYPAWQRVAP